MEKIYKLYQYTDNYYRLLVTKSDCIPSSKESKYNKEELSMIASLSRSKRCIKEISLCNSFIYFFTSTVNSKNCDRFSLTETQNNIRKIMKSIKRKNPNFIYVFITEKHKDGAFHFHGLCSDLELYKNNNGYFSSKDFDKLGFNSFSKIQDKEKVSNYITKYITKSCVRNEAGSIYFCSRGLKRATSCEIMPIDTKKAFGHMKHYENDFIKLYDFNIKNLTQEQKIYIMQNLKEKNTFLKDFLSFCRIKNLKEVNYE